MKLTDISIRNALAKVKQDELFRNAPRYSDLLEYLVEKSIHGESLKEMTIGLEFFGKQYDDKAKSSGAVRVYMFNLRKRLNEYYATRGGDDIIRFELSKGSYNICFTQISTKKRFSYSAISIIALAVLMVITTLFIIVRHSKELYCWDNILNSESDITVILADILSVQGNINGNRTSIIHPRISTHGEYLDYIKAEHCDTLKLNSYSLYTKAIPYSLCNLTRWFCQNDKEFDIISESELNFSATQKNNIIYIGQSKTMGVTANIFLNNSSIFSVDENKISVKKGGQTKEYNLKFLGNESLIEYAIVSYAPLQNGNEALFFVSNNDVGTMATVHRFTDLSFVKDFYREASQKSRYFNALFMVTGVERNEVDCKLVELEWI